MIQDFHKEAKASTEWAPKLGIAALSQYTNVPEAWKGDRYMWWRLGSWFLQFSFKYQGQRLLEAWHCYQEGFYLWIFNPSPKNTHWKKKKEKKGKLTDNTTNMVSTWIATHHHIGANQQQQTDLHMVCQRMWEGVQRGKRWFYLSGEPEIPRITIKNSQRATAETGGAHGRLQCADEFKNSECSQAAEVPWAYETLTPVKLKHPSRTNPPMQQGPERGGLDKWR